MYSGSFYCRRPQGKDTTAFRIELMCFLWCTALQDKSRKPWFGRDEKVSEQIQANRNWSLTMTGELTKTKQDLEQAILGIPAHISHFVTTEVSLMQTRVKAIKLVWSLQSELVGKESPIKKMLTP